MIKFEIELSDKLCNMLDKIRKELSTKENINVSFDDMIEEALLSYYNIKLYDMNFDDSNIVDAVIVDDTNLVNNNDYYVYAYYDMRKKIYSSVGNFHLYYEPIYFGRGIDDSISDISNMDTNLVEHINHLKSTKDFCSAKLVTNISEINAYYFEQLFIRYFGRLNNGTGILYNKNDGVNITTLKKNDLKYDRIFIILEKLNTFKNIRNTAKSLNISERTLYRKIDEYKIKKDMVTKKWFTS